MQAKLLRRWRIFFLWIFSFSLLTTANVQAQTLTLAQLPYQNPQELEALLALDETRFALTTANNWPQIDKTLARYIPAGIIIDQPSFFFSSNSMLCTRTHQALACRVYLDFLAYLMRSKQLAPASTAPLPVLMRPAQLPWRDTAVLNALLAQDRAQLQSALTDHWPWVHQVITRFLPDHVDLHPISKIFGSVRDTCNSAHTEVACREHLLEVESLVTNNRRQPRTLLMTLEQLPYRDPSPIDNLLRMDETQLRTQLANNWPQIDSLLNQYIAWNVAIAGAVNFARSRMDCQAWMPGDYFLCRMYFRNLTTLMRDKNAARTNSQANPFGQRRR